MKKALLVLVFLTLLINGNSQILDVPYRSDISGGNWCWAKTAHMIIVYYGTDVEMCELLELRRQINPSFYGYTDCCIEEDSCIGGGGVCGIACNSTQGLLTHYGITSWCDTDSVLSEAQVQIELGQNRPIATKIPNHIMLAYGYDDGNMYFHNTGNGSMIISYNDFINGVGGVFQWEGTVLPTVSATTCPVNHYIPGVLKLSPEGVPFIYKATQDITIACQLEGTVEAHFLAGDDISIETEFSCHLGSSFLLESGATIVCP